jgi:hypothetical protein
LQQQSSRDETLQKRENDERPQGFSKGKNDSFKRQGPIMIEEILTSVSKISKTDMSIREMEMRTDPTNEASPRIKRRFKPLDNPETILEVLRRRILVIKEGVIGNNVTTGQLQYNTGEHASTARLSINSTNLRLKSVPRPLFI